MRITVNLATRPYVELSAVLRKLRIAMIGLGVLCLGLGVWTYFLTRQDNKRKAAIAEIDARTSQLRTERSKNEARMRLPANAAELQRSQFLNTLFARKAFSWTAVLMDLEEVLPSGLQVSNIEPQLTPSGDVQIRLRVTGDRDRGVELIRNLEKSKRFVAPRLASEAAQQAQQNNGRPVPTFGGVPLPSGVEFDILAGYNPLQARTREEKPAKKEVKQ